MDRPPCRLIGTDGNVFAIIGRVSACLREHDRRDLACEWASRAMACRSYNEVLALMSIYVDPY